LTLPCSTTTSTIPWRSLCEAAKGTTTSERAPTCSPTRDADSNPSDPLPVSPHATLSLWGYPRCQDLDHYFCRIPRSPRALPLYSMKSCHLVASTPICRRAPRASFMSPCFPLRISRAGTTGLDCCYSVCDSAVSLPLSISSHLYPPSPCHSPRSFFTSGTIVPTLLSALSNIRFPYPCPPCSITPAISHRVLWRHLTVCLAPASSPPPSYNRSSCEMLPSAPEHDSLAATQVHASACGLSGDDIDGGGNRLPLEEDVEMYDDCPAFTVFPPSAAPSTLLAASADGGSPSDHVSMDEAPDLLCVDTTLLGNSCGSFSHSYNIFRAFLAIKVTSRYT
jgi:hypothetical protein